MTIGPPEPLKGNRVKCEVQEERRRTFFYAKAERLNVLRALIFPLQRLVYILTLSDTDFCACLIPSSSIIPDSLATGFHLGFLRAGVAGATFPGCRKSLPLTSIEFTLDFVNVRVLKKKAFTRNNVCISSLTIAQAGDGITIACWVKDPNVLRCGELCPLRVRRLRHQLQRHQVQIFSDMKYLLFYHKKELCIR